MFLLIAERFRKIFEMLPVWVNTSSKIFTDYSVDKVIYLGALPQSAKLVETGGYFSFCLSPKSWGSHSTGQIPAGLPSTQNNQKVKNNTT